MVKTRRDGRRSLRGQWRRWGLLTERRLCVAGGGADGGPKMPVSGGGLCRSVAAFLGKDSKVTPLTPYPLAPSGTPYPLAPSGTPYPLAGGAFLGQDSKVAPLTPYPLAPSGTPYPLAGGAFLGQDSKVDLDHAAPQTPLTRGLSKKSSSASGTRGACLAHAAPQSR